MFHPDQWTARGTSAARGAPPRRRCRGARPLIRAVHRRARTRRGATLPAKCARRHRHEPQALRSPRPRAAAPRAPPKGASSASATRAVAAEHEHRVGEVDLDRARGVEASTSAAMPHSMPPASSGSTISSSRASTRPRGEACRGRSRGARRCEPAARGAHSSASRPFPRATRRTLPPSTSAAAATTSCRRARGPRGALRPRACRRGRGCARRGGAVVGSSRST